jgi:protein-disulfide isomerase
MKKIQVRFCRVQGYAALDLLALTVAGIVFAIAGYILYSRIQIDDPTFGRRLSKSEWKLVSSRGDTLGNWRGKKLIVIFSDFQCPYCAHLASALERADTNVLMGATILFRQYPLKEIHPFAFAASIAATCAGMQDRFTPYHNALFAQRDSLGKKGWWTFAAEIGVKDSANFARCLTDRRTLITISEDIDAGDKIAIRGTPTVVVNRYVLPGTPTIDQIRAAMSR